MEAIYNYPRFEFSVSQLGQYMRFIEENGYIHFKNFISKESVNKILSALKEVEREWIAKGMKKIFGIPIVYGKDVDGRTIVQRFPFATLCHPYFKSFYIKRKLCRIRKLLGCEYRIGKDENDGAVSTHYINLSKEKALNKMGWHTDSARDFFYLRRLQPFYNVGIHLDDCRRENGGLRVLPGTHKQNLIQLLFKKLYFVNNKPDPKETVIEVEAGDLTIHSGKMWHRVAQSSYIGEKSRRRVIYFPFILGKKNIKTEKSWTPIYLKVIKAFVKVV